MLTTNKIIFAGPVGVGKTSAITAVSDIPPAATEALATDETMAIKSNTTVAMDYGILNLDNGEKVHLYGTPGQERFSFMWDILTQGGIGLILLLNNKSDDPLADLEFYINSFKGFITEREVVIGVSRMDEKPRPGLYTFQTKLEQMGMRAPIFEIDARNKDDMKMLLMALMATLNPSVRY
jgi:signal recognition particle receptor subunit beta